MRTHRAFGLVAIAVLVLSMGCAKDKVPAATSNAITGPKITVGSANFTEAIVLGEIYAQGLTAKGFTVTKKLNIGAREAYYRALKQGSVSLIPDYLGSLLSFLTQQKKTASPDPVTTLSWVKPLLAKDKITPLTYAAAQDSDGIVTNKETATKFNLKKVSDLKGHSSGLVLGGPPECKIRQACLKGLESVYGLTGLTFRALDPSGPQTVDQLKANQLQLADVFSTDSRIPLNGFVLLDDDKHIVGSENVMPIVRDDILSAYGSKLTDVVNAISAKLTTAGLTALNDRVDNKKEDADVVAANWLKTNGLD